MVILISQNKITDFFVILDLGMSLQPNSAINYQDISVVLYSNVPCASILLRSRMAGRQ